MSLVISSDAFARQDMLSGLHRRIEETDNQVHSAQPGDALANRANAMLRARNNADEAKSAKTR